jgi:endonuclease/exonuclease/phosphatase family metal-dependent hydrolase
MSAETFTLYLHNISGGRDCRGLEHPAYQPGGAALDDYLSLYQQQSPKPDILVLIEAHADNPPETDPGDGSAGSEMAKILSDALGLPNSAVHPHSASHLDPEKSLATAVLTHFPINHSDALLLPNPDLTHEVHPGVIWKSFDKKLQVTNVQTSGGEVDVVAYHGVPFHRFGERLYSDSEPSKFGDYRLQTTNALLPPRGTRRIIAGDFNNYEVDLEDAFPGLISGGELSQAIQGVPTMPNHYQTTQFDHVLYQPPHFEAISKKVIHQTPSDHSLLIVQFKPR